MELKLHALLEQEIFYPEVRASIDAEHLMDEAQVEHEMLDRLMADIESVQAGDDQFHARITVLQRYVRQHVRQEQLEIFPKAKKSGLDLVELGRQLQQRKNDLILALSGERRIANPFEDKPGSYDNT